MSENVSAAKSVKTSEARFGGKGLNIGIVVSAIVVVIGLVLWGLQLSGGFMETNMRDFAPWGISLAMFMLFVGLSVGSMVVATAPRVFGMKEGFGGIEKVAVWASLCCTVLAIGFVVVDLGNPLRLWELFAYSNMSSPLMWDIVVLGLYLVLTIALLVALVRLEQGKVSAKAARIVAGIVLVWALVVCTVDAWIFSLMPSRDMWNTSLLGPWFVASGLASGTALVMILGVALRKSGLVSFDDGVVSKLAKLMGAFVVVDLYCFACDLMTAGFPGGDGTQIVSTLLTGTLAPFFWTEVVACVLAAVVCFVPKLRTVPFLATASVLVIVGVACKRMILIIGGFQIPALGDMATFVTSHAVTTDWAVGLAGAFQAGIYLPSLHEVGLVVGVCGLGVLMLLLGLKLLPLGEAKK